MGKSHFKEVISNIFNEIYSEEDESKFVSALQPYAQDLYLLLTKEGDVLIAQQETKEDPLVYWRGNLDWNFMRAKKRMIEKKLIPEMTFKPTTIYEFQDKYRLKYICTVVISL